MELPGWLLVLSALVVVFVSGTSMGDLTRYLRVGKM